MSLSRCSLWISAIGACALETSAVSAWQFQARVINDAGMRAG